MEETLLEDGKPIERHVLRPDPAVAWLLDMDSAVCRIRYRFRSSGRTETLPASRIGFVRAVTRLRFGWRSLSAFAIWPA